MSEENKVELQNPDGVNNHENNKVETTAEIAEKTNKALEKEEAEKKKAEEKKRKEEEKLEKEKKKREEKERRKRDKKPFLETPFGAFVKEYWFMMAFLFVNLVIVLGLHFIKGKFEVMNQEFKVEQAENIETIEESKEILEKWGRQITFLQGESLVENKIEKKNEIRAIVDKYTKNYIVTDDEKGSFSVKIPKRAMVESNISRLILELKENKFKLNVKGLSKTAIELKLMFKV